MEKGDILYNNPIDKGWAWATCIGNSVVNMYVNGGIRVIGLLFIEIQEYFHTTRAVTAMITGTQAAGFALFVCIGNILGVRFDNRKVAVAGAILTFTGMFLASFAPSMALLVPCMGLLSGIGYGLMFGPGMVIVGQYFKKYLSIANGISMAGGSLGQLILPYVILGGLKFFALRGCLLLYSAVILHAIPATLLFRCPEFYGVKKPEVEDEKEEEKPEDRKLSMEYNREYPRKSTTSNGTAGEDDRYNGLHRRSSVLKEAIRRYSVSHQNALVVPTKEDVASVMNVPIDDVTVTMTTKTFCARFCDPKLLCDPRFFAYTLGLSFGHCGYVNCCLYLAPYSLQLFGQDQQGLATLIIAMMGVADFVGRIGGGIFSSFDLIRKPCLVGGSFIISGIVTLLLPFFPSVGIVFLYAVVLGILGGTYMALFVVIAIELFGRDNLASVLGVSTMVMGLFIIPFPPLFGKVADFMRTFAAAMRFAAVFMLIGGLFFYSIPFIEWIQTNFCKKVEVKSTQTDASLELDIKKKRSDSYTLPPTSSSAKQLSALPHPMSAPEKQPISTSSRWSKNLQNVDWNHLVTSSESDI